MSKFCYVAELVGIILVIMVFQYRFPIAGGVYAAHLKIAFGFLALRAIKCRRIREERRRKLKKEEVQNDNKIKETNEREDDKKE